MRCWIGLSTHRYVAQAEGIAASTWLHLLMRYTYLPRLRGEDRAFQVGFGFACAGYDACRHCRDTRLLEGAACSCNSILFVVWCSSWCAGN